MQKIQRNSLSSKSMIPVKFSMNLTDRELYSLCKKYGGNARLWLRKFAGLLPEVYRRHLYKRRGYISIHEFAAKLSGMNHKTVDKILRLEEKLKDKPILLEQFETGLIGWSKIEKVAYIATPETDVLWADKAATLGKEALEKYVQEYRKENGSNYRLEVTPGSNFSDQPSTEIKPKQKWNTLSFPLSPEMEQKLRILKRKFEKEKKVAMGWNEVMREILKLLESKENPSGKATSKPSLQLCPECLKNKADTAEENHEVTRYLPAEIEKFIEERSHGVCEYSGCNKPSEIYHHTRRFALRKNHDPEFIRALCKAHEEILQAGLVENEEKDPTLWKIRIEPEWYDLKNTVDQRVAEFRKEKIDTQMSS